MSRQATYSVKPVDVPNFKSGNGFAVIDQDNNCPAVFAQQADAYNWIDTETKAATDHAAIQLKDPATAFRRIEHGNCGEFLGYAGDQFRARFDYEDDAIEWRAADPLNKGSIGELIDREELRKVSDYERFLSNTTFRLNKLVPQPTMDQARAMLTKECESQGFNRAATSVRMKAGKLEVYALGK